MAMVDRHDKDFDLPIIIILSGLAVGLPLVFLPQAFDIFGAAKYTWLTFFSLAGLATRMWTAVLSRRIRLPSGKPALLLSVLLSWLALAVVASPIDAVGFFGLRKRFLGLITYLAAAILFALAAGVRWDRKRIRGFLWAANAAATAAAILGLAQYFGAAFPLNLKHFYGRAAYSTFGNPAYFGLFLALIIPTALYLSLTAKKPLRRGAALASTVLQALALYAAGSAGALLGATAGCGFFAVRHYLIDGKEKIGYRKTATAILIAAVLGGSVYAGVFERTAIGQRSWIWLAAAKVAVKQPVFGAGPENLRQAIRRANIAPEPESDGFEYEDAHNYWLNYASAAGWPAMILLAAVLISIGRPALRAGGGASDTDAAILALSAGALGYLTAAQFNPEDLSSLPIFWIFLGVIVGLTGEVKTWRLNAPARVLRLSAAGVCLLLLLPTLLQLSKPLRAEMQILKGNNAGDINEAKAAFQAAQALQPRQGQYYLMEIYRLLPQIGGPSTPTGRELIRAAQAYIDRHPNDADGWLAMGEIYRTAGVNQRDARAHELALSLFQRAYSHNRYSGATIKLIAVSYRDLGATAKSRTWAKRYDRHFAPDPEMTGLIRAEPTKTGTSD